MGIERKFERSPENEILGTVEKNGGGGAFEILRRMGAGDCCRDVEVLYRISRGKQKSHGFEIQYWDDPRWPDVGVK